MAVEIFGFHWLLILSVTVDKSYQVSIPSLSTPISRRKQSTHQDLTLHGASKM